MNQKIKIMNPVPPVSDDEIRSQMNFDKVLELHQRIHIQNRLAFRKRIAFSIISAIVVLTVYYYFASQSKQDPVFSERNHSVVLDSMDQKTFDKTMKADHDSSNQRQNDSISVSALALDKSAKAKPEKVISSTPEKTDALKKESVYVQAEPARGYENLFKYLKENITYPPGSIPDSIQGEMVVSFIINVEGKPENISFTKSLGSSFDREALRLVENMPAWKPAFLDGKPVKSRISLPLTFQLTRLKNQE